MADFPYLNLFTDAFLADTSHLDATETGAYLLLLIAAWRTPECALPDDDVRLARMARCDARTWGRVKATVLAFWTKTETGLWQQKRLTKEREFCNTSRVKKQVAAATRWKPKPLEIKEQGDANAYAEPPLVHMQPTPTPTPTPTKIEKNSLTRVTKEKPMRLPDDFKPDQSCHDVAAELGLTPEDRRFVFDQFRDYWRSVPGAKGLKLDWQATFRNWMRKAHVQGDIRKPNGTHQRSNTIAGGFDLIDRAIEQREREIAASQNRPGRGEGDPLALPGLWEGEP